MRPKPTALLVAIIVLSSLASAQNFRPRNAIEGVWVALCILFNTIYGVAGAIAALLLAFNGLKYVSSDNPEERAKIKGRMHTVIVGLVIVIVATALANIIVSAHTSFSQFSCEEGYIIHACCTINGTNYCTLQQPCLSNGGSWSGTPCDEDSDC